MLARGPEGTGVNRAPFMLHRQGILSLTPFLLSCSTFVHVGRHELPDRAHQPRSTSGAPATLTRLGRVLNVVRKLLSIGQQLIASVHQRAAAPDFWLFAKPFGTTDLALIIARITGGLRRAVALEAMLSQRVQRGEDLTPSPSRAPATPPPRAETERAPPAPQLETRPQPAQDPRLANLPTEAEIAAEIRRRPIGAVIVSICEDLGITPGQLDPAFWDELSLAIICCGGSLAAYVGRLNNRLFAIAKEELANPEPFLWPEPPNGTSTGPRHRPALKAAPRT